MSKGLKENETLTNLHLANCNIGEDGTYAISETLVNKKNLLVLDMTNNKTMVNGCIALCKSIQQHSTLRELYLSNNFIGPDGAK